VHLFGGGIHGLRQATQTIRSLGTILGQVRPSKFTREIHVMTGLTSTVAPETPPYGIDGTDQPSIQRIMDDLSRMAGVDMFVADEHGRLVTKVADPTTLCPALDDGTDIPRPCLSCPRREALRESVPDPVEAYPCPVGLSEVLVPIMVDERVAGYVGSVQMSRDKTRLHDLLGEIRKNVPKEDVDRFMGAVVEVPEPRLKTIQAMARSVAQLLAGVNPPVRPRIGRGT